MFKVIDNLERTNNHYNRFRILIKDATDILIVSPFLMQDFTPLLSELDFKDIKSFNLITTLKGSDQEEQIRKLDAFISIIDFFSHVPNVKYSIKIDNKLHGKVYIFRKNDKYLGGLITSANFTDSGLNRNHEWGVEIHDETILEDMEKSLNDDIQYSELTIEAVLMMMVELENYYKIHSDFKEKELDLDLSKFLPEKVKSELDIEGKQFWLKPIGVSDNPIKEGEDFSSLTTKLDFSKKRPSGVKIKDIVITYCVGMTKILSVYQVVSDPIHASVAEIEKEAWRERWPWSIQGQNLTPDYGSRWWRHNLTLSDLVNDYLDANPDSYITSAGGKTLGALRYGLDKVKLNHDFAKFIINKVI